MSEGSHYRKGITDEQSNSTYVPKFLSNLRGHPLFEDLYRPVDARNYRDRTVRYIQARDVKIDEPKSDDSLEFRLSDYQDQDKIDATNRILVLSNKILVTTREVDQPSQTYSGEQIGPQQYLDEVLKTLDPLSDDQLIDYGSHISHLFTKDKRRNFIPDAFSSGLAQLTSWYSTERKKVDKKNSIHESIESLDEQYMSVLDGMFQIIGEYVDKHGHYDLNGRGRTLFNEGMLSELSEHFESAIKPN